MLTTEAMTIGWVRIYMMARELGIFDAKQKGIPNIEATNAKHPEE